MNGTVVGAKLIALHQFLLEQAFIDSNKFDAYMTEGPLKIIDKNMGNSIKFCRAEYQAVLMFDRCDYSPAVLFCLVLAWLADNDPERCQLQNNEPTFDITEEQSDLADIEITIPFFDDLHLVEDEEGLIPYCGNRYNIAVADADVAETINLFAPAEATPELVISDD